MRADVRPVPAAAVAACLAAVALLLQASGIDLALADLLHDDAERRFLGRGVPWIETLGHRFARALPVAVAAGAWVVAAASFASPRLVPWRVPAFAVGGAILATTLLIAALKQGRFGHCPAQLDLFGGAVSLDAVRDHPFWGGRTATSRDCVPSAHAGGGFSLIALWFAGVALGVARLRRIGLALALAAGLAFAAVRASQGAHFASQAAWSAFAAWCTCAFVFRPLLVRRGASVEADPTAEPAVVAPDTAR